MQLAATSRPQKNLLDIPFEQAMADFLFVNNIVTKGAFLSPREGMISKFFLDMPPSFSSKIILVRTDQVGESIQIALNEELSDILMPLDFSICVNKSHFAFIVNAMSSNFVIRIPVLSSFCEALVTEFTNSNDVTDASTNDASEVDSFLADLEAEASAAKTLDESANLKIMVSTFYPKYGFDFALKKSASSHRNVDLAIVDEALSIN